MEAADLHPLVDDLTTNIDSLSASLSPLIKTALSNNTSKLPLLDKAKLYVLTTYAIESLLFSSLRLNGVDAKSHPVFQELGRVKEYFAKIKTAETGGSKRSLVVDKEAAGRFVKAGLAGNEKMLRGRKEGAKRKFEEVQVGTHTRFNGSAKRIRAAEAEDGLKDDGKQVPENGEEAIQGAREPQPRHGSKGKKPRKRQVLYHADTAELEDGPPNGSAENEDGSDANVSQKAPKSSKQALESLLSSATDEQKPKKKKKHKSQEPKLEDRGAEETK